MSRVVIDRDGGEPAVLSCVFCTLDCFMCIFTQRLDGSRHGNTVGCACVLFSMGYYYTAGSSVCFALSAAVV